MVYHHRVVECPFCGEVTERTHTVNSEILKGSPFRVCPHCKATYFDSEFKEMGLVLFEDKGGTLNIWGLLWSLISNIAVIFILYEAIKYKLFPDVLLLLGIFGVIAILFDIGLIRMIKNHVHSDEYHQSQIDYIEGRAKNRTPSLIESMERLSNKEYLDALKSHGVNVPNYFYERLYNMHGKIE